MINVSAVETIFIQQNHSIFLEIISLVNVPEKSHSLKKNFGIYQHSQ